jgi:phosphoglycolate phosphatase-like HAD superfamily hydrolase
VIFDLDGTLVDSDAFDGALYGEAVREVIGDVDIDESWRRYRHVTDAGVLAQIIEERGLPRSDDLEVRIRAVFGAKVQRYLAQGGRCECVPGAKAAIEELQTAGCAVGIATGGWGHTARMKLAHAGIPFENLVLTSSDDSFDRVEIMSACLQRLGGTPERAVYVGDGQWDLEASRRAGWRFVGVGEKLKGVCVPWVANFVDPAWQMSYNNALLRRLSSERVADLVR